MVAAVAVILEMRRGPDRRRRPRGGRREGDLDGVAPLVLLVGNQPDVTASAEAILAKLRFAVATSSTVEDALRVASDLHPDVVVAAEAVAAEIEQRADRPLRLVRMTGELQGDPNRLLAEIRHRLRVLNMSLPPAGGNPGAVRR